MICPMVPFLVILSDPQPRFEGHSVIFIPMNDLNVLCAQFTCDLFPIAKFLFFYTKRYFNIPTETPLTGASNAARYETRSSTIAERPRDASCC